MIFIKVYSIQHSKIYKYQKNLQHLMLIESNYEFIGSHAFVIFHIETLFGVNCIQRLVYKSNCV